jgi:hypothetical protein
MPSLAGTRDRSYTNGFLGGARLEAGDLEGARRAVEGVSVAEGDAADGTNFLYVTPKTVEVHLSNAYRKLNIASRRELPQALTARV